MRFSKAFPTCFLLLFLTPLFGGAQDSGAAERVELRKVRTARDGSPVNGHIPDSLGGGYFLHDNGKLYKHFAKYEMAVAHQRGYYPRKRQGVEEGVVYVSYAPTKRGKIPDALRVGPEEGRVEPVR